MKRKRDEPTLTSILEEDAKEICSREQIDRVWRGIEQKLDEQQEAQKDTSAKRLNTLSGSKRLR